MLLFWIKRNRVGFLVDSSILGFAIGTGFALVENLIYLHAIPGGTLLLWAVRGCGTAIMHGVATACVGTLAFALAGSRYSRLTQLAIAFVPSLTLHVFFNSGILPPAVMAEIMILASVVLMILIFTLSERMLAGWLNAGLSQDIEVWDMLQTGRLGSTEAGRYLNRLRTCFPPQQAQDLFRLVRIHIELRTQAKGEMILRQHGVPIEPDPALGDKLRRFDELQRAVGLAGRRALAPLIGSGGRTVWEIQRLKEK
ncbi:MAG: PrsW family intramembrane metalloprotease [Bryobacterales bacterium]|nr:PrsW family intramembrane metalloprotease [Bryobacterales bacterium]